MGPSALDLSLIKFGGVNKVLSNLTQIRVKIIKLSATQQHYTLSNLIIEKLALRGNTLIIRHDLAKRCFALFNPSFAFRGTYANCVRGI